MALATATRSTKSHELGTIETNIPARLDRLPWASWHWRILVGLGTVWILDGLEVTIVGSIAGAISAKGSGINISAGEVAGWAASLYVAGACVGALLFGRLTDLFGRKRLFMITLGVYLTATIATAFAPTALFFFVCRFVTGMGIGGEYSAINSAIDELIPAKHRGRIDILINGTYWAGAAAGALLSVAALHIFSPLLNWRICFALGAILGTAILIVRRHVPESPRWLFIHGREDEAEEITRDIERQVEESTGKPLEDPAPEDEIAIRQRKTISLVEIARTVVKTYPKRTVLGLALFIGQAFLYNSILFGYATLLSTFFHVSTANAPYYLVAFAAGTLLGPVVLGGLVDPFLLRLGRGQRCVSDGLGDLPPRDPRAMHRTVLRGRHGTRRDHRPAAVRADGRDREGVRGVQGAGDRRGPDDPRRRDRDRVRHRGRAKGARVDRQAADRGDRRRAQRRIARRRSGSARRTAQHRA